MDSWGGIGYFSQMMIFHVGRSGKVAFWGSKEYEEKVRHISK